MTARILVVEDDEELGRLITGRLNESGYTVDYVKDGSTALDAVRRETPDLVLLDVMLPGVDGLEVCRTLRAQHPLLPIIMLTARADELDRVVGLEVGADDYVTKPFSLQELMARVRAALRRMRLVREGTSPLESPEVSQDILRFNGLEIDPSRREVRREGEQVHLTVREFDLLLFMARNPDRPFTRSQLLDRVWNIHYEGYDRTVDSHVQRLRAKIEKDPANPQFIRTVWGIGYKFQAHGSE